MDNDNDGSCALLVLNSQESMERARDILQGASAPYSPQALIHPSNPMLNYRRCALQETEEDASFHLRPKLSTDLQVFSDPDLRKRILETTSGNILNQALIATTSADDKHFLAVLRHFLTLEPLRVVRIVTGKLDLVQGVKEWRERVHRNHLEEVVRGVIRTQDIEAMEELLTYEPTANNPKLHEAIINHPLVSFLALRNLILRARGDAFRLAFRTFATQKKPKAPKVYNGMFDLSPAGGTCRPTARRLNVAPQIRTSGGSNACNRFSARMAKQATAITIPRRRTARRTPADPMV